jgi:hypothetical protein
MTYPDRLSSIIALPGVPASKSKSHLSKLAKESDTLFGTPWLEQYAAICHRPDPGSGEHVFLLITSRGSGRWVITKGGR